MKTLHATALCLLAILAMPSFSFGEEIKFKAELTAKEVPFFKSHTTGEARFEVNAKQTAIEFELEIDYANASLAVAGAHIHCTLARRKDPIVVPLAGAVPGGFDGEVEIEAMITKANIVDPACGVTISALVASMKAGHTYVDVHSATYPGGEIRGPIRPIKQTPPQGSVCGTIRGLSCPQGQYCDFGIGRCGIPDAKGTCKPKPEACTMIFRPVCGCDGKTYSNACLAASAGVTIKHLGKCTPKAEVVPPSD